MGHHLVYEIEPDLHISSRCCLKSSHFEQNANTFSSDCIWKACKALIFGFFLMLSGAILATIGNYGQKLLQFQ